MIKKYAIALAVLQVIAISATTIDQIPISLAPKTNIIFGLDDSSSMDSEVMQDTNDGAVWWNTTSSRRTFIGFDKYDNYSSTRTTLNFNSAGEATSTWKKYVFLFPNGSGTGNRINTDSTNDHYAIAPIDSYANFRSSSFNPLYYNPSKTYTPWVDAYSGGVKTFVNATPTAAKSHPALGTSTIDLTKIQGLATNASTTATAAGSNFTFKTQTGMPSVSSVTVMGVTRNSNGTTDVTIPYLPATYWIKLATATTTCPTGFSCATAIDGNKYQKVEIIPTTSQTSNTSPATGYGFPSGRSYADEIQNFANWFQYYRKRKLMLAAAMGGVFFPADGDNLKGANVGVVLFNDRVSPTMYDVDSTTNSQNGRAFLWSIYTNPADSGTPMRETLSYIGGQFNTNTNIIQYSCQKNSAFILTDGYANTANVTTSYASGTSKTTWGSVAPYTTTFDGSLADIAMEFYTKILRSSDTNLLRGKVRNNKAEEENPDLNTNLHMNTYALTLGAKGLSFTGDTTVNPFTSPPTWLDPTISRSPIMVDDLWHSTINGRGKMYTANDIDEVRNVIKEVLLSIIANDRSVDVVANPYIDTTNNFLYSPEYISMNQGDFKKYEINLTVPPTLATTASWSFKSRVDAAITANSRKLVTFNGTSGVGITDTSIRTKPLGSIINASPLALQKKDATGSLGTTIYQASNDGFLHVIDGATGNELWAYRPMGLGNQVANYTNYYVLDSAPAINNVGNTTLLVGGFGLNSINSGFYALDVTNAPTSETDAATKVLWEFPTTDYQKANLGMSTSRAAIIKVKAFGDVVVISSGYNNTATVGSSTGDGQGHVWLLNPLTGVVLAELKTGTGSISPLGMASLVGYVVNPRLNLNSNALFGGDELGNIWKFDLTGTTTDFAAGIMGTLVATLGSTKPITVAVNITADPNGKAIIYAVTGKFFASSDITNTSVQSFVAILDRGVTTTFNDLLEYSNLNEDTTTSNEKRSKGVYYNFTGTGERGFIAPTILSGLVIVRSIRPVLNSCDPNPNKDYIFNLTYFKPKAFPSEPTCSGCEPPTPPVPIVCVGCGNENIFFKGVIYKRNSAGVYVAIGNYVIGRQMGSWREILRK